MKLTLPKAVDKSDPINANATNKTKALYRYLKTLMGSPAWAIGQFDFFDNTDNYYNGTGGTAPDWVGFYDDFNTISGKRPAFMMFEYADRGPADQYLTRQTNLITRIKQVYAAGSFVFLTDHSGNPSQDTTAGRVPGHIWWPMANAGDAVAGTFRDLTGSPVASIQVGSSDTVARQEWLDYLTRLAAFFNALTDANGEKIPVIWRFFQEVNMPSSKWWNGYTAPIQSGVIALWQEMVTSLNAAGVTNVLFDLNYDVSVTDALHPFSGWYPGDAYFDILSFNCYIDTSGLVNNDGLNTAYNNSGLTDAAYAVLLAKALSANKVLGIGEIGYKLEGLINNYIWEFGTGSLVEYRYKAAAFANMWRAPWGPRNTAANGITPTAGAKAGISAMINAKNCITQEKLKNVFKN